jgi:hypothetical protein
MATKKVRQIIIFPLLFFVVTRSWIRDPAHPDKKRIWIRETTDHRSQTTESILQHPDSRLHLG